MTRKQVIDHWAEYTIPAVFRAENLLRDKLQKILDDHKDDPTTAAELYCHAIAEEIVRHTTDEEFEKW